MLGANSRTVHFFRFKSDKDFLAQDIDDLTVVVAPEENKFGMFFKKLKDTMLPASLTHDKSNLRIYMDKALTKDQPYIIFPSNNSTLIVRIIYIYNIQNIVTYTGYCMKYSIENLLTEEELQIISPSKNHPVDFFK